MKLILQLDPDDDANAINNFSFAAVVYNSCKLNPDHLDAETVAEMILTQVQQDKIKAKQEQMKKGKSKS